MPAPVYLGDEVSGAGWRLAGAEVHTPAAGGETAALMAACTRAPLVLLSASVARAVEVPVLHRAQLALAPLVLVVPDLQGGTPPPDLAARLRSQLGLDA
ncbi:MAG: hypothetical protein IPF94_17440 [Betaproteobacteria bacterium]|nr:hypothetical protein [Betaproteobacteria bacterium]